MEPLSISFIISAFIAGFLMFLAPCTLPLVPAFLAFISGVKQNDVADNTSVHAKVIMNAVVFTLGFSLVFISFGILAGFLGSQLGIFRNVLTQLGGLFIIIFGLMMLHVITLKPLTKEVTFKLPEIFMPGSPQSAFFIGAIFALGWTPCVGPILASVLLLAATGTTAFSGGFLLAVFTLGLSVPFLLTAVLYTKAGQYIERYGAVTKYVDIVGGVLLVLLGVLLLTDHFDLLVEFGYRIFSLTGADVLFTRF